MASYKLEPIRLTVGYNAWNDADKSYYRFKAIKNGYIDISDEGTARFSKRMAEEFQKYLIGAISSGELMGINTDTNKPHGILTGEMIDNISVFRTTVGGSKKRHGWVVSIKEDIDSEHKDMPVWYKLSWLEFGTVKQKPRFPIRKAFNHFLVEKQSGILQEMGMDLLRKIVLNSLSRSGR